MDYSIILDLLIDYFYIDAVVCLFRVNTSFYNRLVPDKIKIEGNTLKEKYRYYLISEKLNTGKYCDYFKLCAKYDTDYMIEILPHIMGNEYCIHLAIKFHAEAIFKSLVRNYKCYCINEIIQYGTPNMIITYKNTYYTSGEYKDLLEGKYSLCNNVMMYKFFKYSNVPISDYDIKYADSPIPLFKFMFEDKDVYMDIMRLKIIYLNKPSITKFILEIYSPKELILLLERCITNFNLTEE